MKKIDWAKRESGVMNSANSTIQGKGFYISYNANVRSTSMGIAMDNILHAFIGKDESYTGEETALVKKGKDEKFYILNGDFRKEYEKLLSKGFKVCYEFYLKNKEEKGSIFSDENKIKLKKL